MIIPVQVHAVMKNGKLIADPDHAYEGMASLRTRNEFLGWVAMLMAFGAVAFVVRGIKNIWRVNRF